MRLRFSYGLPVLRRDFRLRRILAVRIWLCLLLFYRMCNRIQGRTPVFLKWTFGISYDPSDVVSEVVHLCSHGLRLGVIGIEDPSDFGFWNGSCCLICWLGSIRLLVSEMDPLSVHGWRWSESLSSSEPSLADQISTWGRLWSMNSWVMASMMNYLIKNISELFIVLYDHIAIYSKSAWPTFSKADTETDCSSQKLHMFRRGFPLPSLSTGWPGFGGKRIGFAF
jgi:hypothetical protein